MAQGAAHNRRRPGRVRGQSGLTLIEVLISVALIGILIGALTSGVVTMARSSSSANSAAKANVTITSFAEALKQIGYRDCSNGDLAEIYLQAFHLYEDELPEAQRLVPAGSGRTSVEITGVDTMGGCVGGAADSGEQVIDIAATVNGKRRTGQVVKRNLGIAADGPVARADADLVSPSGNSQAIFSLSAVRSTPQAEIIDYSWDCGDTPPTTMSFQTPDDPGAICSYAASPTSDTEYTVSLTVTDVQNVTNSGTVVVTVPRANAARPAPVAVINATPTSGNADLSVSFNSNGSNSLVGTIDRYEWDFGDPLSGSENTSSAATPPNHVYRRAGTFTVRLTVTDEVGLSGTTTRQITVTRPGPTPPTASFTRSPQPAVAPQLVSFDGRASRDAAGNAVSSYVWDFGNGVSAAGATTSHRYTMAGTYTVRLTVTDSAGTTGTTTRTVVIGTQAIPPNFRLTDAKAELASDGHFYFAWTNPGASAGDTVSYEIEVRAVAGCVAFGTKTRTVTAGAAGTLQTYDFRVGWPASNVCVGSQYDWRVRTIRVSPTEGTQTTPWSLYSRFTVTHT